MASELYHTWRAQRPSRSGWTFVAMYTDDFADRAQLLIRSCKQHGAAIETQRIEPEDYRRTIASKPEFMLRTLKRLRRPIVYLDADFEVMQYPALFDNPENADFMIYNWYADPGNSIGRYHPEVLLSSSGVIYWNWTAGALRLLREWRAMANANPLCADDQILDRVFNEGGYIRSVRCCWLPRSYLRIEPYFPDTEPVLNHADAPGTNGPAGIDVRGAIRPFRWRLSHRFRAWGRRLARITARVTTGGVST
jgi:hypothetical protein